ncbi:MAG: thioredoxin-dependent thiol peroxidase [Candidatus Staskawiczbacteria bacterium]|nr:thioredoxin-dependent thiol peroxidase [Candidatus Staskawiczbacteria bacterium]
MKLKVGDRAPDFTLPDQNGKSHSLDEFNGKWLLLYFYPKDNTEGCTKEACMMRDDFFGFKKLSVQVVGVSIDSVKSHKSFEQDYNLPFLLLADEDKDVVKLYGVWGKKKFMGREYDGTFRMSFLINPKGKIEKIYEKVKPLEHSKEVLEDLKDTIK